VSGPAFDLRSVRLDDGGSVPLRRAGAGATVVLVQTALTVDELLPVGTRLATGSDGTPFDVVLLHRRGYAGSVAPPGRPSVAQDVRDCVQVLEALGPTGAHLVGVSYSAAVVLQVAADVPHLVRTLTLVEPPPVLVPDHDEFTAATLGLIAEAERDGAAHALETFGVLLAGPSWRRELQAHLPGAVEQAEADAATFFSRDLPALLGWRFDASDATRVRCPVLHVGATGSGPWFAAVRSQVLAWFPDAHDVLVEGADHLLAVTHADEVAAAVAAFLRRHP
jgi:pimeloyl-ACP methyl ester carboxylesterase